MELRSRTYGTMPWRQALKWDIYNAQGRGGGDDVTDAVRVYDIPMEAKRIIIEAIKLSPFMTPSEIEATVIDVIMPKARPSLRVVR